MVKYREWGSRPTSARLVLLAALGGVFATTFPSVILVASLGSIADDLHTSESTMAWVVSAPLIASSVSMPVLGKLGDRFGHRRVFLAGFGGAAIAASLTAAAPGVIALIALRTLGQTTGAATQPTSLALIMNVYPPERRARAMGWWSLVSGGAPAIGLVIGGPLVEAVGWRVVFLIQALLALAAAAFAAAVLRESTPSPAVSFDVRGAVFLATASGAALLALDRGGKWGVSHPAVLGCLVLAIAAGFAFAAAERRAREPLLPLRLLTQRQFSVPASCEFLMQATTMGSFTVVPLLLRSELGYSVSEAAGLLLVLPLSMSCSSPIGGALASRRGERVAAVAGAVALLAASMFLTFGAASTITWSLVAGLGCLGLANGLARPAISASAANALSAGFFGVGMATTRMIGQLGSAFGVTVLVARREAGSHASALAIGLVLAGLCVVATARLRSSPRPSLVVAAEL